MNYYEHYLGDYMKGTAHLSITEHGAYRLLMDEYYNRMGPLPKSQETIYRILRATKKSERSAIHFILKNFFTETKDGWHHERCDAEIARYLNKREKARASANAGVSARRANAERPPSEGTSSLAVAPALALALTAEEESAAFDISTCPKDMDTTAERKKFSVWCQENGVEPTAIRWLRWVERGAKRGYVQRAPPPPPPPPEPPPVDPAFRAKSLRASA